MDLNSEINILQNRTNIKYDLTKFKYSNIDLIDKIYNNLKKKINGDLIPLSEQNNIIYVKEESVCQFNELILEDNICNNKSNYILHSDNKRICLCWKHSLHMSNIIEE